MLLTMPSARRPCSPIFSRLPVSILTTSSISARLSSSSAGALKSGAIDASEWVGPWLDMELGLHRAADYYYYPGFHEPGTNSTLGINKTLWDGLTPSERALIEVAAAAEVTRSLAEFNAENVKALKLLRPTSGSRSCASTTR